LKREKKYELGNNPKMDYDSKFCKDKTKLNIPKLISSKLG
jgi:hypothetical protein